MKLNKSQEELDNEKKGDFLVVLGVSTLLAIMLSYCGYNLGYKNGVASVKPETVYVSSDLQRFTKDCDKNGLTCHFRVWFEGNKVISVLEEQKKCEEMGGEFRINTNYGLSGRVGEKLEHTSNYTLSCTSPSKELFKYNIK